MKTEVKSLKDRHIAQMHKYLDWLNALQLSYYERHTLLALAETEARAAGLTLASN